MTKGRLFLGRRRDGAAFPVEVGLNPLHTDEGNPVLGVIVDVSERCRNERIICWLCEK
jgi:hypothetical protein